MTVEVEEFLEDIACDQPKRKAPVPICDLSGTRFGMLCVVRFHGHHRDKAGHLHVEWNCVCDCGSEIVRQARFLLHHKKVPSCGCLSQRLRIKNNTTHGLSHTREYRIWQAMHRRCTDPRVEHYRDYGGRGITVSDEWKSFEVFYADMGPRPSKSHSIERRDNDAGYSKSNCVWATASEQAYNKRNVPKYIFNGELRSIGQIAKVVGIPKDRIYSRLKMGLSVEDAISLPPITGLNGSRMLHAAKKERES